MGRGGFPRGAQGGLLTGFVSNGNATPEVLAYLDPWMDLYKVDLKSFDDRHYRKLGGRLAPILDSITRIHQMGFWLEIVTLLVAGFNDSAEELHCHRAFSGRNLPKHPLAHHCIPSRLPDARPRQTTPEMLRRAAAIGREAGLLYVYAGNLPGATGDLENTTCPHCATALIRRSGFHVLENRLRGRNACPSCGETDSGVWAGKVRRATRSVL